MIDTIVNSFDVWTDAQGIKSKNRIKNIENISLEGISRLRELILELAVLGKLVPQDSNDEPATILLKNIEQERAEKNILKKRKKKEQAYTGQVLNSKIEGWELCKLEDIGDTNIGLTYSPNDLSNNGTIVLRSSNIQNGEIDLSDLVRVNKIVNENVLVKQGDLLICARNGSKKLVGKCALIRDLSEPMAFGAFMAIFRSPFNEYCRIFIESPIFRKNLEGVATTTINQITQDNLKNTYIALPPLAEQQRIVAKVDELIALCDKLEEEQFKNLKTHQILVKTLLETLTQAADANELQEAWERMDEHFDILFYTEDSIEQLKQTILQLAVMGKLVKQDPNDEPASELLKKIAKEKDRLIKEGKIKNQTPLADISQDEKPFELPKGWEWTRLGKIGVGSTGKTPSTNVLEYFGGDIPFIGPGQITSEGNIIEADKTLTDQGKEYTTVAEIGDILMVCIGGTIGKCAIVKYKTAFNQQINCIRPLFFNTHFLYDVMNATYFQQSILSKSTGSATPIINRSKWEEILIPVPSLSEQIRIIKRIDELFTLCESLRNNIRKSEELKVLLSKTIIEKAVK